MTTPASRVDWRSRIVRRDDAPARELVANPRNWRTHPENQSAALTAVLDQVGWVQSVIVNDRSGRIVDGHLRARLAAERDARIPVVWVDLTEEEETLILATLDPLAAMAGADGDALEALLREIATAAPDLAALLSAIGEQVGIPADADGWAAAFAGLPDGDSPGFQQMTFTLSDSQVSVVQDALARAKAAAPFGPDGTANSNGNALVRICAAYR